MSEDLMNVLADEIVPITRELFERLDADLSEKDRIAVTTALTKMAITSAKAAMADAVAQVDEQLRDDDKAVSIRVEIQEHDSWAERYGEED